MMNLIIAIIVSAIVSALITEVRCRIQFKVISDMVDKETESMLKTFSELADTLIKMVRTRTAEVDDSSDVDFTKRNNDE